MIYYVAFYNPIQELGKRVANYAGEDKIDYICKAVNDIGEKVTILSNTKSIIPHYLHRTIYEESEQKKIVMFASLPRKGRLLHAVDVIYGYTQLAVYLLKHVKSNDVVIVYHSLGYRDAIRKIRNLKSFKYILEVEELFQFIEQAESSFKQKENTVFNVPDGFIFSNDFLNQTVNIGKKPSVVINGIYKTEQRMVKKENHYPMKLVYAGTFQPQKGVDYIIKAAQFLDEKFEIRIIGFGSEDDKKRVEKLIEKTNATSTCKVYFDGTFKGADYIKYIQQCDVGFCIQDPDDLFNRYEFPSKIFSYLSNGLRVVTNRLEQIEHSKVYPYLTVAESTKPEDIAVAVRKATNGDFEPELILNILDSEFKNELTKLLKGE